MSYVNRKTLQALQSICLRIKLFSLPGTLLPLTISAKIQSIIRLACKTLSPLFSI